MKPLPIITVLALIGSHWTVYQWSDANTLAKQEQAVREAVEAVNEENIKRLKASNDRYDSVIDKLNQERQTSTLHRGKLKHLRRQLDTNNLDMESRRRSLVELCELFDAATNSPNLPNDNYPEGTPKACETITLSELSAITESQINRYNREAIRANALRVEVKSIPCVN